MPNNNDFDRLRLIRSPKIGPVTYKQLITRFGSAGEALNALPDIARRGGGRKFAVARAQDIEKEMQAIYQAGAQYSFIGDTDYPALLAQLDNAPPVISYKGNLSLAQQSNVAIVGARNASASACRFARQLAVELGREGVMVTSGLARGIDTASHIGGLEHGTIAVIAGGINVVYPPENEKLQNAIAEKGLLIAEQPPGVEPRARHFPHRNRIIAGLSSGTVIVEAAPKSGSLITARLAGEAGRHVMAIPGSPLDPRAKGCNQLIRDGAILVQDAADICELIKPIDARKQADVQPLLLERDEGISETNFDMDTERQIIINLLGMSYVSTDELVRQSGVSTSAVQMALLELELAGRLERGAGAKVRLIS